MLETMLVEMMHQEPECESWTSQAGNIQSINNVLRIYKNCEMINDNMDNGL